tara:strand:+ start:634 stop:831 length:198 start_codon:yes stop_codon:yes gene_type:complete
MHISPKARAEEVLFLSRKASFFIRTNERFFIRGEEKRVVENGKGKRQGEKARLRELKEANFRAQG